MATIDSTMNNPANPVAALWRIAVSEYEAAQAEMQRFDTRYHAANKEYDDAPGKVAYAHVIAPMEEELNAICGKLSDAREKLVATPAPDAAALFLKTDILLAFLRDADSEDAESFACIAADAKRLLTEAA